jgi:hypothetical protein
MTRPAFHRSVNCLRRGQSANFDFDLHWRARERSKLPETNLAVRMDQPIIKCLV